MLFRTKYSQETLESLKSLVQEEKTLKKISGFILDNRWIYFTPTAFNKICVKNMKTIIRVKSTYVKKREHENIKPFVYRK
jgi:hypothetical protein